MDDVKDYLKQLSSGKHSIQIVSTTGIVATTFEVKDNENKPVEDNKNKPNGNVEGNSNNTNATTNEVISTTNKKKENTKSVKTGDTNKNHKQNSNNQCKLTIPQTIDFIVCCSAAHFTKRCHTHNRNNRNQRRTHTCTRTGKGRQAFSFFPGFCKCRYHRPVWNIHHCIRDTPENIDNGKIYHET